MKAVIQRVSEASVTVEAREIAAVGPGLLVLLCVEHGRRRARGRLRRPQDRESADLRGRCRQDEPLGGRRRRRVLWWSASSPWPAISAAAIGRASPAPPTRPWPCRSTSASARAWPSTACRCRPAPSAPTWTSALVNDGPVTIWMDTRHFWRNEPFDPHVHPAGDHRLPAVGPISRASGHGRRDLSRRAADRLRADGDADQLIDAPAFKKAPGGAPANVAVGLARLGVSSAFMGKVGDDPFGHFLADTLAGRRGRRRAAALHDRRRARRSPSSRCARTAIASSCSTATQAPTCCSRPRRSTSLRSARRARCTTARSA